MAYRSQTNHHRALFLAALFLTLSFALRAELPAPPPAVPDAPSAVAPSSGVKQTPDPAQSAVGGQDVPPQALTKDQVKADDTPVVLPTVKPIEYDASHDNEIAYVVGQFMVENHYLQRPIDAEMSQRWLKNYFDALDYNHLFFLQSDIDEFTAKYGNNLGDLLQGNNNDVIPPAFEIYNRYMQRLNEGVTLAEKLVHDKYDFTKDETYAIRTHKSPWIKDAAAADEMWRQQIKSDLLNGLLEKKTTDETIKRLSKRYASILRDGTEQGDMDVLSLYLSALTHAYDPHSDYFSPEDAQTFAIAALNHAVTGIGAVLRSDDGYATIEEIIPGGPADLDKHLQPGDRILAVGQGNGKPVDAVYMKLDHVVDMIRGEKGSLVHLVVAPHGADIGEHKDITLKRDTVSIKDSLAKAHIIEHQLPGGGTEKLGVIYLHDFYNNTDNHHSAVNDVTALIKRLKNEDISGIILDMRGNGGGLLDQAVDLTGLFAKHEPVVQIRRSDGNVEQLGPEDVKQIYSGPLLVMVNKMSASATEIVAAALQDYGRAVIVGDQSTHGKGTVQTLLPLDQAMPIGFPSKPGPGNLKITVQKFYRVAGGSTQQKGVVPDVVLPSVLDALELGETTLPYYLPYDTVPKASYDYLDLTSAYLPDLQKASMARVVGSPDFGYVRQDIDYYKKKLLDSNISLNEAVRIKEQADQKTLMAQRKKDLLARQAGRDKVLELTLDMVDQNLPAAPPVVAKPKVDTSSDDSEDEPDPTDDAANPTDDPQLDEAVNIMTDYTRMLQLSGSKLVQATPAVPPTK